MIFTSKLLGMLVKVVARKIVMLQGKSTKMLEKLMLTTELSSSKNGVTYLSIEYYVGRWGPWLDSTIWTYRFLLYLFQWIHDYSIDILGKWGGGGLMWYMIMIDLLSTFNLKVRVISLFEGKYTKNYVCVMYCDFTVCIFLNKHVK